jgi:RNA polymerase sigma-70 factor (ECF subfamily)
MYLLSWDEAEAEEHYRGERRNEASPDKLYEHAWALTLLDKVMKDLQQECVRCGKTKLFETLQIFLTGEDSESTYEDIGQALNMGESAVKMAVLRLRRRYGEMLRNEIAHTVADPTLVEDELHQLMSALSR